MLGLERVVDAAPPDANVIDEVLYRCARITLTPEQPHRRIDGPLLVKLLRASHTESIGILERSVNKSRLRA
jgi:hypothetical protein